MNPPGGAAVICNGWHEDVATMRRAVATWAESINTWTGWLAASGASPGTVRLRRWHLRKLAEAHLRRSPWRLTPDQLAAFITNRGWGPEALKSARSSLRSFYGWARLTGRTKRNPTANLPTVHVPPGLPRPAPDNVLAAALAAADDRLRLMLLLGAYAGLRTGEISRLALTDLQPHDGVLVIRGKGGRWRRVPIHSRLAPELSAELARRRAGTCGTGYRYKTGLEVWLFPGTRRGLPVTPNAVSRRLSTALGEYTAHQLRHRFASVAYDRTRDLRAVQELLGHAHLSTTAVYTARPDAALMAAVESVE